MPSIPQSLLWISLVVLWLFVLVPMLISKRDAVRRTSDVALASRVLNGGAGARLLKRTGPAAGHRSDPDWTPEEDSADDELDEAHDDDVDHEPDTEDMPARPVVMRFAVPEETEPDYLDVDVVEDSSALPAGVAAAVPEPLSEDVDEADEDEQKDEDDHDADLADLADRYEYVEDSSGLEPEDERDYEDANTHAFVAPRSRQRRFDSTHAATISAKKYAARKRVLMVLAVILVGTATTAFEITPIAWWACGGFTALTLMYLGYLRRQTRIEEKVRRRRTQRMARARLGVENAHDRDYDVVPSRLRRPGAVVLEIDDEDPIFEHLDYAIPQQNYGWSRELPRAVGQ